MPKPWVVMKFGGSSLVHADQWRIISREVGQRRNAGHPLVVVVSALAGVTDALQKLDQNTDSRSAIFHQVKQCHESLAEHLGLSVDPWLTQGLERLDSFLACESGPARTARILSMGEWFASKLGVEAFSNIGLEARWVDATGALQALSEPDPDSKRAWLSTRCEAGADPSVAARWLGVGNLLVTQGFVVRAAESDKGGQELSWGETPVALLGRSGSDTSAALLASRLGSESVEIWTDVPGLFSADPRTEPDAKLITELAWDEALEMAASGARVIHGRSIRAAAQAGITIWIRQLADDPGPGTRILPVACGRDTMAHAVMKREGMVVLLLRNLDTRQQVGFLASVFRIIAEQGLSVDQVATSETTTTLAIDREANHLTSDDLNALKNGLDRVCEVQVFEHCSCVSLVGRNARQLLHSLVGVREIFQEHPLYMMSHSANDLSISLLVPQSCGEELARRLHRHAVLKGASGLMADSEDSRGSAS